jgi:hypothetical protein
LPPASTVSCPSEKDVGGAVGACAHCRRAGAAAAGLSPNHGTFALDGRGGEIATVPSSAGPACTTLVSPSGACLSASTGRLAVWAGALAPAAALSCRLSVPAGAVTLPRLAGVAAVRVGAPLTCLPPPGCPFGCRTCEPAFQPWLMPRFPGLSCALSSTDERPVPLAFQPHQIACFNSHPKGGIFTLN